MICPRCNKEFDRLLAVSRKDGKTMICERCGTEQALDDAGLREGSIQRMIILENLYGAKRRPPSPQERTKAQVMATGNKWAIENFNATHN